MSFSATASAPKRRRTDDNDDSFEFYRIYVNTMAEYGYDKTDEHENAYDYARGICGAMTPDQHALFEWAAMKDIDDGEGYAGPTFTDTMGEHVDGFDDAELTVSWFMEAAFKDALNLARHVL